MFTDITVLDFSRLLPGPYASMLLADMGINIIKVEEPKKGDYMRDFLPDVDGEGAFYLAVNRGKKSIAIDYRTEEGKNILYQMIEKSDVIIESFRPGVMKAFGLDYESVKEINPQIIYCSLTGYGQEGALKDKAGHDVNYLAMGGAQALIAHVDDRPAIPGIQIADLSAGMYAAMAIMSALFERISTGKGKYLDISMLDGILSWFSIIGSQQYLAGKDIIPGNLIFAEGVICYNIYKTRDKRYIALGALEEKFWKAFCTKIAREDLIEKQFEKAEKDNINYLELQKIFRQRTLEEWTVLFDGEDVCLTPVLNPNEVMQSQYVRDNKSVFNVTHPSGKSIKQIQSPISKNFGKSNNYSYPPRLGEHTEEILKKFDIKN